MEKLPLLDSGVGIERIDHLDPSYAPLPASHDAEIVGSKQADNVGAIYEAPLTDRIVRGLQTPSIPDPSMLNPARFEASVRDAIDKVGQGADMGSSVCKEAARHLRPVSAARELFWAKLSELSQV
ncbi:MAG: hypothetical protein AAF968_02225 [Pseudomonadota bacterium]